MSLFPTLAEYFMYSHLPYSCILLCCLEEGEYFDEDFFLACETPGHLPVVRWCLFRCLVLSGLVIRYNIINTGYVVYSTICRFMCET
jgi:hypothetical protein